MPWFYPAACNDLFLPFAWDARAQRLYVDLNRNRDLTDDPAGVFIGTGNGVQLYRGLRLEFSSLEGRYQVRVDAQVLDQGGIPRVFLYVRSLWEGAVELGGKKWYVAVIGKPDGRPGLPPDNLPTTRPSHAPNGELARPSCPIMKQTASCLSDFRAAEYHALWREWRGVAAQNFCPVLASPRCYRVDRQW